MASATGTGGEPAARSRVAVLLSGRGSNYRALQEAVDRGRIPAEIVLVVSNVPGAAGLEAAATAGVPTRLIPHRSEPDRRTHEAKVLAALDQARVEWVCLAGYMRLLSAEFVERYRWRILNIHPSLLPSFPGLDVHRQALDYGVQVSGCTVHLVDAGLDSGPIVVQRAVPVLEDDTPESLAERILVEEHHAYPEALRRLLREPWRVEGRRVRFHA
ncbi:MAG TPA: phosphoribosylglycinamide formyltransferase [Thermoanaerobaculia bacterium]|nr:phosphoribosylglycinamide formyltransferase [Thermoanaerobaculia bacterium]